MKIILAEIIILFLILLFASFWKESKTGKINTIESKIHTLYSDRFKLNSQVILSTDSSVNDYKKVLISRKVSDWYMAEENNIRRTNLNEKLEAQINKIDSLILVKELELKKSKKEKDLSIWFNN